VYYRELMICKEGATTGSFKGRYSISLNPEKCVNFRPDLLSGKMKQKLPGPFQGFTSNLRTFD